MEQRQNSGAQTRCARGTHTSSLPHKVLHANQTLAPHTINENKSLGGVSAPKPSIMQRIRLEGYCVKNENYATKERHRSPLLFNEDTHVK